MRDIKRSPLCILAVTGLIAFAVDCTTASATTRSPSKLSSRQKPPAPQTVNATALSARAISVVPNHVELSGNFARTQLLVSAADLLGKVTPRSDDLTTLARYASSAPEVVQVGRDGALTAAGNGQATIRVVIDTPRGALAASVLVTVRGVESHPQVGYARDIAPIFSKAGCNMGACHAAQYGQAGFKLSVFGYDPSADHASIVRDRSERRVNFLEPERSLL